MYGLPQLRNGGVKLVLFVERDAEIVVGFRKLTFAGRDCLLEFSRCLLILPQLAEGDSKIVKTLWTVSPRSGEPMIEIDCRLVLALTD